MKLVKISHIGFVFIIIIGYTACSKTNYSKTNYSLNSEHWGRLSNELEENRERKVIKGLKESLQPTDSSGLSNSNAKNIITSQSEGIHLSINKEDKVNEEFRIKREKGNLQSEPEPEVEKNKFTIKDLILILCFIALFLTILNSLKNRD